MNTRNNWYFDSVGYPPAIITQQCECCGEWVDQEKLVWDLEADRLVCKFCFKEVKK